MLRRAGIWVQECQPQCISHCALLPSLFLEQSTHLLPKSNLISVLWVKTEAGSWFGCSALPCSSGSGLSAAWSLYGPTDFWANLLPLIWALIFSKSQTSNSDCQSLPSKRFYINHGIRARFMLSHSGKCKGVKRKGTYMNWTPAMWLICDGHFAFYIQNLI